MANSIFTKTNGNAILIEGSYVLKALRNGTFTNVTMKDGFIEPINETPSDIGTALESAFILLTSGISSSNGEELLVNASMIQRAERYTAVATKVAVGPGSYVVVQETPATIQSMI